MRSQSSKVVREFGGLKIRHFVDNNNARIQNLGNPLLDHDAVTKKYVDDNIGSSGLLPGTGLNQVDSTFNVNSNLSHVTGLGNINSGTWSANSINVPYGGTGKTSFSSNKLIMGDGLNPLVSISEISFESNRLQSTAPVLISNTTNSTGIGSGGSFTTLGGGSISGKLWLGDDLDVKNNVNIQGNVTLGNLIINGNSNFGGAVSSLNGTMTNSTITNLLNTNITTSSISTTNIRTTNITSNNILNTNLTTTNLISSNISTSTLNATNTLNTNITTNNLQSTQIRTTNLTTSNVLLTNLSGTSAIISNLNVALNITASNIITSHLDTTTLDSTNGTFTSITSSNIIVNASSRLANTTISNLFSTNITSSNIRNTNLNSTNISTNNLETSNINSIHLTLENITTNNIISTNITTNNIISTNISTSNVSTQNILTQNITSSTLRITGISNLSSINANSLSAGTLSITGLTNLTNTVLTNSTIPNIANINLTNTNFTTTNLTSTNITASNLHVSNLVTLGSVVSSSFNTGNIFSTGLGTFNNSNTTNATISNLRVTNVAILGTVSSSNLSTGNIFVSSNITVPFLNATTQTISTLLATNIRSTNITSTNLQITGISILTNVTTNNLYSDFLTINGTSNLPNIIGNNITTSNLLTSSCTSSELLITNNASIHKRLSIGSDFSSSPQTTSGNILHILPIVFNDTSSLNGDIIPLWSNTFIGTSTLSSQNSITTQKAASLYIQSEPVVGLNQTIQNAAGLAIGYVENQTGGNLTGQIMLERNDGNWYGSIYTEATTNRIVIANASLSGGGGIGLYTYSGTKISFANIPSATNIAPTPFLDFSNTTSTFYSTIESNGKTSGSVVISGGLGVSKTIHCETITPTSINASIKTLQDVDDIMTPTTGQALVWNGSMWTSQTISGGGGGSSIGSIGPTPVAVYAMELVMPEMNSNGPVAGNDGNYYVSASSEFNEQYAAYKCLSSITNPTDWATAGETNDFWIKVQLPSSQNVRYILLEGRTNNEDPVTITVQGSNDDLTYTDIYINKFFTALNYPGYFAARIPENSKDYIYYKFLFPTSFGVNPGINMLRLFKYDNTTYTEGILDNSATEGNGKFNGSIVNGRWPMAFELSENTIVNIRAQITCFTSSALVLREFVMYIDGSPFQDERSTFIKQCIHKDLHTSLQTLEWTGSLPSGIHTLSFFVNGGTGVNFDTNDNIRVHIVKY